MLLGRWEIMEVGKLGLFKGWQISRVQIPDLHLDVRGGCTLCNVPESMLVPVPRLCSTSLLLLVLVLLVLVSHADHHSGLTGGLHHHGQDIDGRECHCLWSICIGVCLFVTKTINVRVWQRQRQRQRQRQIPPCCPRRPQHSGCQNTLKGENYLTNSEFRTK